VEHATTGGADIDLVDRLEEGVRVDLERRRDDPLGGDRDARRS
jgi:hypothetical protein